MRNVLHDFAHMYGSPCCYDHLQVMGYFFDAISTIIPPFLGHDSRISVLIFLHSSKRVCVRQPGSHVLYYNCGSYVDVIRTYIPSQFLSR